MPRIFRTAILIALVFVIPANADESAEERRLNDMAFDLMIEGQTRVMGIVDRIRIAGADLCGKKVSPVIGVFAIDHRTIDDRYPDADFVKPFVEATIERYQLDSEPRVLATVPGLAAARGGLLPGDVVKAVDGTKIKKRVRLDLLRGKADSDIVRLEVEREGVPKTLELEVQMGCSIPGHFEFGPRINAYAMSWGRLTGVYFYSGILGFLPDDDQLAVVVGHEFAHMVLGHTGSPRGSKRYEAESDYLGLYFAARAGYDISKAPGVWDAFARSNPYAFIDWGFYRHPTSAKRSLELRAVLAEIAEKQLAGLPLEPNQGSLSLKRPDVDEEELEKHQQALRGDALERLRADQTRIQDVSYRLAIAGKEICGEHIAPVLGASVGRRQDFMRGKKAEAEAAFGVGDDVTVFAVAQGSPAALAGIQLKDRILKIDGDRIKKTQNVFERMRDSRAGDLSFQIGRGDDTLEVSVSRQVGCEQGTLIVPSSSADTGYHANRTEMEVPTGLLRFVRDDDELAIAISHQMGHQILGSMREATDETKADELGLRIARAAGYEVSKAPAYWDRYAAEQFWKISADTDDTVIPHGAMSSRAPAIRDSLEKIASEGSSGPPQ